MYIKHYHKSLIVILLCITDSIIELTDPSDDDVNVIFLYAFASANFLVCFYFIYVINSHMNRDYFNVDQYITFIYTNCLCFLLHLCYFIIPINFIHVYANVGRCGIKFHVLFETKRSVQG